MHEFTTTGDDCWFKITGRGDCASFPREQIPEGMWDPGVLAGQQVLVDGVEYKVRGVEMFRPMISPDHPYHLSFSLLLGERKFA